MILQQSNLVRIDPPDEPFVSYPKTFEEKNLEHKHPFRHSHIDRYRREQIAMAR